VDFFPYLHSEPRIVVRDNILNLKECDAIINAAKGLGLKRNKINIDNKQVDDTTRTSQGVYLLTYNMIGLSKIFEHIGTSMKVPLSHAEPPNVQRYLPGEEYQLHWDAFKPGEVNEKETRINVCGNRTATVIIYLNDVESGGWTGFPNAGVIVSPKAGRVLAFKNLTEENEVDVLSAHAGYPVREGEKWICTLWFRQFPYVPSLRDVERHMVIGKGEKQNG